MKEVEFQPWYQSYASAIVELDPKRLIKKIGATETAIRCRLEELRFDSDHHEERRLLMDAQRNLALLRECGSEYGHGQPTQARNTFSTA